MPLALVRARAAPARRRRRLVAAARCARSGRRHPVGGVGRRRAARPSRRRGGVDRRSCPLPRPRRRWAMRTLAARRGALSSRRCPAIAGHRVPRRPRRRRADLATTGRRRAARAAGPRGACRTSRRRALSWLAVGVVRRARRCCWRCALQRPAPAAGRSRPTRTPTGRSRRSSPFPGWYYGAAVVPAIALLGRRLPRRPACSSPAARRCADTAPGRRPRAAPDLGSPRARRRAAGRSPGRSPAASSSPPTPFAASSPVGGRRRAGARSATVAARRRRVRLGRHRCRVRS